MARAGEWHANCVAEGRKGMCREAIMRSSFTVGVTLMLHGMSTRIGALLWEQVSVAV